MYIVHCTLYNVHCSSQNMNSFQIVDLMKDRAKREAFLVSDRGSSDAKDLVDEHLGRSSEGGEEGSGGKGTFARLVSDESKQEDEEEEEGSGLADYLEDDPLLGNLRAINLSDLEAGGKQQRKMLGLQSLGERLLWDLSTYWYSTHSPHILHILVHIILAHL